MVRLINRHISKNERELERIDFRVNPVCNPLHQQAAKNDES